MSALISRPMAWRSCNKQDTAATEGAGMIQGRLWKQGAEENRTQPIVMRFTGREGIMAGGQRILDLVPDASPPPPRRT